MPKKVCGDLWSHSTILDVIPDNYLWPWKDHDVTPEHFYAERGSNHEEFAQATPLGNSEDIQDPYWVTMRIKKIVL